MPKEKLFSLKLDTKVPWVTSCTIASLGRTLQPDWSRPFEYMLFYWCSCRHHGGAVLHPTRPRQQLRAHLQHPAQTRHQRHLLQLAEREGSHSEPQRLPGGTFHRLPQPPPPQTAFLSWHWRCLLLGCAAEGKNGLVKSYWQGGLGCSHPTCQLSTALFANHHTCCLSINCDMK